MALSKVVMTLPQLILRLKMFKRLGLEMDQVIEYFESLDERI